LGLQIANYKIGVTVAVKVGGHHGARVKIKSKPGCKMRVDKSVLVTGKEPVDFPSRKALS